MEKGENDRRKYSMINLHETMLPTRRRSNPQPPNHQSDAHPTEPPRPALVILSLPLIQEGQLSVSGGRMCTILVNRLED